MFAPKYKEEDWIQNNIFHPLAPDEFAMSSLIVGHVSLFFSRCYQQAYPKEKKASTTAQNLLGSKRVMGFLSPNIVLLISELMALTRYGNIDGCLSHAIGLSLSI